MLTDAVALTSPEVPIDRVKVDEESEGLSRSLSRYNTC